MKFNPRLKEDMQEFYDQPIIVEGKKDANLLLSVGFKRVFAIHEAGIPLAERINHLSQILNKRDKVCILTDFGKMGKKLYFEIKELCEQMGIKTDSKLRGLLLVSNIKHIEEIRDFVKKAEGEMRHERKHWEIR